MPVLYPWDQVPGDEVWAQMTDYWAATGQLDRATLDGWDGSEAGFFQLGTLASSQAGWASDRGWGEASPVGSGRVGDEWVTGFGTGMAGAWR